MSDNNEVQQQEGSAAAQQQDAPAEKVYAGIRDVQTPDNTPMSVILPSVSDIKRELTEEERERGYMTVFLGNSKASQMAVRELITAWLQVRTVRSLHEEGEAPVSALNKAEEDWNTYVEEKFPGQAPKAVETRASELYEFASELLDEIGVRSKTMNEPGITNQNNRGSGVITNDLYGKKPSRNVQGVKLSDFMRRATLRSDNTSLNFDVLLRDSFVLLTFERPNKMEMGDLINDIRREVKGYVRRLNNNNAVLAGVAVRRVIWKFIVPRIISCSVSDIGDFNDLAKVILLTDFDRLVIALLDSFTTKGVNMNLRCLGPKCDWSVFGLTEPSHLVKHRTQYETAEEQAVYGNLLNATKKYTSEEVKAFQANVNHGLDSDRVYNEDESIYLKIGSSTLDQAFATFDFFVGQINPKLADIRMKVTDPKEYEAQTAMVFNDLGATEFIHWVQAFVVRGQVDTDEPDTVIRREDSDPAEFNEGLMKSISDSKFLNRALTKFILNKTPHMTRNIIGVRNYECPKCRAKSGEIHDQEGRLVHQMGYTPIDAVMSFFTHTHLMMLNLSIESNQARNEALSE